PVAYSGNMLLPLRTNCFRTEKPVDPEPALLQQFLRPIPQRPPEPIRQWHGKTMLTPSQLCLGEIFLEKLAHDPFAASIPYFEAQRKPPRKFHNLAVEERDARFQTNTHACTIEFDQNIFGEIPRSIGEHHPGSELGENGP